MGTLKRFLVCGALVCAFQAYALPPDIQVSPAPGTIMESLESFTVKTGWVEPKQGQNSAVIIVNGQGISSTLTFPSYDEVTFTLSDAYTVPGECNIIIPEDVFLVGWEGDPSPLIEFSYIIENDNPGPGPGPGDEIFNVVPEGYEFTPAAGSEVEVLSDFTVVAANDMFLAVSSRKTKVTINGQSVEAIANFGGELMNSITWTLADPIAEPGLYTIYIPEGEFFGLDETDNPSFIVTVKVTGGDVPEPVWYAGVMDSDPVSGTVMESLERFSIFSEKLSSLYIGPKVEDIRIYKDDQPFDIAFALEPDEDDFNEAHVFWMQFASPLTEEGIYRIEIPAKAFVVGKYPSNWYVNAFEISFEIDPLAETTEIPYENVVPTEYFNLQGQPIAEPIPGNPIIERKGARVVKRIIR